MFCLGFGLAVSASDVEKEGRWAEEVVDQLFDGEPVWLLTDSVRFLGLHVVPESGHGGGLLILHGRGVHPDWPQVVNPLRVALAEAGWHTLSLQLPVLANGVPGTDYKALVARSTASHRSGSRVSRADHRRSLVCRRSQYGFNDGGSCINANPAAAREGIGPDWPR